MPSSTKRMNVHVRARINVHRKEGVSAFVRGIAMARTKAALVTPKSARQDKGKRARTSNDQSATGPRFRDKDQAKCFDEIQSWDFISERRVKLKSGECDVFINFLQI
ncbi:hypothetical protein RJT34_31343 [Clitoria ternatea]|uniref:Uncharacterized protein n=1 Tax=Clitoria ternatea TaxID=43366 RepID=A0AAN9EW97_CLITE